jgi:hypothetical protein
MSRQKQYIFFCLALISTTATATGREMSGIAEAVVLYLGGGVLILALCLTLIIKLILPKSWWNPIRWILAIFLSLTLLGVIAGLIWVGLVLLPSYFAT